MENEFQPDQSKRVQEVIFCRKSKRPTYPPIISNNIKVSQSFSQKYLGVILDFNVTIEDRLSNVLAKQ